MQHRKLGFFMPQKTPTRRYVSTQKAAEYADCSYKTIRRLISNGQITGYRVGRVIRVDLNELDEALKPIPTTRPDDAWQCRRPPPW